MTTEQMGPSFAVKRKFSLGKLANLFVTNWHYFVVHVWRSKFQICDTI